VKPTAVIDTECYRDYWLLAAKNPATGGVKTFELYEGHPLNVRGLQALLAAYRVITFNGRNYDMPMIALALTGADCEVLKAASDRIILEDLKPWEFEAQFEVRIPRCDHIDLIEVAPGRASLKLYGGRMHSRRLQDLPIAPDELVGDRRADIKSYCVNDLDTTIDLADTLRPQIELREQMGVEYGMDLRSKSDAQIAEAVIRSQVAHRIGHVERPIVKPGTTYRYKAPEWLRFADPITREAVRLVADTPFVVRPTGGVEMPAALADHKVIIGQGVYRMGIGGLHSSETKQAVHADQDYVLADRDVASYYPAIILNNRLAPEHMGDAFLDVYRGIVEKRLAAKHAGNKVVADSLKIVINGSFGKLGSMWSTLYSPNLLIQVTLTGQLALLMLIERLESRGIRVLSANTDGIVIKCHKSKVEWMHSIVWDWERNTGFDTEETEYQSLYSRDVNNYIAIKPDGKVKTKGAYAYPGLAKNPQNLICTRAVIEHLTKGTPLSKTIRESTDIREFLTVRTVAGGGQWAGMYLGKAVRWYYSTGVPSSVLITYRKNGNKVSRSDGSMPLMVLPDRMPTDINYDWYVREAQQMLKDIGHG
jgi:hypothetical protein